MHTAAEISTRLQGFVEKIQTETNAHYATHFSILTPPTLAIQPGRRFWKIVVKQSSDNGRSVHCFVEKTTGNIYKAATWKAPAEHVRGNIFDANFSYGKGVTMYGGAYLR